jgi:hypothetical protein
MACAILPLCAAGTYHQGSKSCFRLNLDRYNVRPAHIPRIIGYPQLKPIDTDFQPINLQRWRLGYKGFVIFEYHDLVQKGPLKPYKTAGCNIAGTFTIQKKALPGLHQLGRIKHSCG